MRTSLAILSILLVSSLTFGCGGKQADESTTGRVVVTETQIERLPPITFEPQSLEPTGDSETTIKAVASTLETNLDIKVVKIQCSAAEGDVDVDGASDRAESLRQRVVGHGIDAARLQIGTL